MASMSSYGWGSQPMTNPYANDSQGQWASTYSSQAVPALTARDVEKMQELLYKSINKQKRSDEIRDFIRRFEREQADGERPPDGLRAVSSRQCPERYAIEYLFSDEISGKTHVAYRDMREKYYVDKKSIASMKYNIGIDAGSMYKQSYMGEWISDAVQNLKQPSTCKSCKTAHEPEKLDLIGRCSIKLKSHHEKLRKIKNAHNHKKQ